MLTIKIFVNKILNAISLNIHIKLFLRAFENFNGKWLHLHGLTSQIPISNFILIVVLI